MAIISDRASKTINNLHIYSHAQNGNDYNDGLDPSRPKATLTASIGAIPDLIFHNVVLHLSGTYSPSDTVIIDRIIQDGKVLIIDGGEQVDVHDNNGGSMFTADIFSSTTIGVSSSPFTDTSHSGYWVQIDSGTGAGQTRTILRASDTTLIVAPDWETTPDGTSVFHIVKPHTKITGKDLALTRMGSYASCGLQRLILSGSGTKIDIADSKVIISNVISDVTSQCFLGRNSEISFLDYSYNTSSFALDSITVSGGDKKRCGYSSIHASGRVELRDCFNFGLLASYIRNELNTVSTSYVPFGSGASRIKGLMSVAGAVRSQRGSSDFIADFSSLDYSSNFIIDDSSTTGLELIGVGDFSLDGDVVEISDCTNYGIECRGSYLIINGVLSGSGHGKSGLYAHSNSTVHIKNGSIPTLTGSVAEIMISNTGSSQGSWSDLNNNGVIAVTNEMTVLKGK